MPSGMKTFFPNLSVPMTELTAAIPLTVASLLIFAARPEKNAGWLQSQGGTSDVLVLVVVVVDVEVVDVDVLDDDEVEVDVEELDEVDVLELVELEVDEELELDVEEDVELDVDVLLEVLLLVDEDDVVVLVLVVVVVVGGGGRPMTGMRAARHLATVPGTVCAIDVHNPDVLLSQLTTVPTSTMLSASVSTQRTVRLSMFRSVLTPCSMSPQVTVTVSPW